MDRQTSDGGIARCRAVAHQWPGDIPGVEGRRAADEREDGKRSIRGRQAARVRRRGQYGPVHQADSRLRRSRRPGLHPLPPGGMPGYEGGGELCVQPRRVAPRRVHESRTARNRSVRPARTVVILGCYYQRQDQILKDEAAVRAGVANAARWVKDGGFNNVVLEIADEFGHRGFDHRILKTAEGQAELIRLAKKTAPGLLVSTSGLGGGTAAKEVAAAPTSFSSTSTPPSGRHPAAARNREEVRQAGRVQ